MKCFIQITFAKLASFIVSETTRSKLIWEIGNVVNNEGIDNRTNGSVKVSTLRVQKTDHDILMEQMRIQRRMKELVKEQVCNTEIKLSTRV